MNSPAIKKAIQFATEKHEGQFRKFTGRPYIEHPLMVMEILEKDNCSENIIIAGLLHDILKVTSTTPDEIETHFGKNILDIVQTKTDDTSKTWKERKTVVLEHLKTASFETQLVFCADTLSDLVEILTNYVKNGVDFYDHFEASLDDTKWYYNSIRAVLKNLSEYKTYKEYDALRGHFFTTYYSIPITHSNTTVGKIFVSVP